MFTIIVDTREQHPFNFALIKPRPHIATATLATGDYSIEGLENHVTIERKSLVDAYSTFGRGRQRFERELERMTQFQFAAVVIEADWETIIKYPPSRSQVTPKHVYRSVIAWQQRYGVHFWACWTRAFAEKTTYVLLERFWRDTQARSSGYRGVTIEHCTVSAEKKA